MTKEVSVRQESVRKKEKPADDVSNLKKDMKDNNGLRMFQLQAHNSITFYVRRDSLCV